MVVGEYWTPIQMWCRESRQAPLAPSFFWSKKFRSLTTTGERLSDDRALKYASSSCLSVMLRHELLSAAKDTGLPIRTVESRESLLLS
jgi:hypothetical protein